MTALDISPATPQPSPALASWPDAISEFLHLGGSRGSYWKRLPSYAPAVLIIVCGCLYGAIMGGYNGISGDRAIMVLYGALKVPILFIVTMLIAVPCFYVLNLLLGVGEDFHRVWGGLIDYQLSVALQLAALAPVTLFVNATNDDYRTALAWSTLLFAVTGWNARRSLRKCYGPLIAQHPIHSALQRFWFVLYAFVGIQMGWDLRPFVGSPLIPVQFFRDHIGNAYVETARALFAFVQEVLNFH